MTTETISGAGAHASAEATDRLPVSKAGVKGYLTPTQIGTFVRAEAATAELIRDTIDTSLTAGTGITLTVSDAGNTNTIATTITQYTDEMARDALGTALVAGTGVTITPNDGGDTISIAVDGTAIAALTNASAADGTESWHVLQSGADRELTLTQAKTWIKTGLTQADVALLTTASVPVFAGVTLTGGTVTVSTPLITSTQTWNDAGVAFNLLSFAITNTNSAATSTFLNATLSGANIIQITKAGFTYFGPLVSGQAGVQVEAAGATVSFSRSSGNRNATLGGYGFALDGSIPITWASSLTVAASGIDTGLTRDGATGALAVRYTTTAQILRGYYTWTDASNYQRWGLNNGSDYVELAAETAGTGGDNLNVYLTPAGTGVVRSAASIVAHIGTAIPAGGTAGAGFRVSSTSNFGVFFGSGAPSLSAAQGSLYLRSDGSTGITRAYINTDGGTTWTAITTVA